MIMINGILFVIPGKFHDQGDAKWITIRRSLWGHNDMPCPGQFISRPRSGRPQGVFGIFRNYQLVILIFSIAPLIMEFTSCDSRPSDSLVAASHS
jgi:hypothetical protein